MKDSEFKYLPPCLGDLVVNSRGTEVAPGYKPDLTIVNPAGQLTFIVECEQKTDRKAFLGDLIKAEKYAEDCKASPSLIIVMQPAYNTTVNQIAKHLKPYATWLDRLKPQGLNLAEVLVISDDQYLSSMQGNEILGSTAFRARSRVVKSQGICDPLPLAGTQIG